jgi:hypothetical protein
MVLFLRRLPFSTQFCSIVVPQMGEAHWHFVVFLRFRTCCTYWDNSSKYVISSRHHSHFIIRSHPTYAVEKVSFKQGTAGALVLQRISVLCYLSWHSAIVALMAGMLWELVVQVTWICMINYFGWVVQMGLLLNTDTIQRGTGNAHAQWQSLNSRRIVQLFSFTRL